MTESTAPSREVSARLYRALRRAHGPTRWGAGCLYLGAGLLTLQQLREASIARWEAYGTAERGVAAGLEDWEARVYGDVLRPSDRVLLVECGTGRDLIELVRLGCEAVGLEQSPVLADQARAHLRRLGLAGVVVAEPVESHALATTYDAVVFSLYMYSHIIVTASRADVPARVRGTCRLADASFSATRQSSRSRLSGSPWRESAAGARAAIGGRIAATACTVPRRSRNCSTWNTSFPLTRLRSSAVQPAFG